MKALITGASSGIGMCMARELCTKCNELIIVARTESKLVELKKELEAQGGAKVKVVAMDLSVADNCKKLHKENGGVDLLINNAGFGDTGLFDETDLDKDLAMINTNITATHVLTKLYLKDMKKRNAGTILNVASVAGFMPGPRMATYYATKGYVVRLSEAIREELRRAKSKVHICVLCPGPVDTNFAKQANVDYRFDGVSSEYVAKYALSHLNRFYIVPTFGVKCARHLMQVLPGSCSAKIMYKYKTPKKNKKDSEN